MKISKELLKGSTNMLVLKLIKEENMYGYQMIKKLKEKSQNVFELKEGTLYPILHLLEENEFITSYWDNSSRKKQKILCNNKQRRKRIKKQKRGMADF